MRLGHLGYGAWIEPKHVVEDRKLIVGVGTAAQADGRTPIPLFIRSCGGNSHPLELSCHARPISDLLRDHLATEGGDRLLSLQTGRRDAFNEQSLGRDEEDDNRDK